MDWYLEQALNRSNERVREAQKARLIQEALAVRPAHPDRREQALVRVGGWLVGVGQRLQLSGGVAGVPTMSTDTAERR
jgi:hypothetical protein